MSYWYTELGIKQIYICPDVNYAAAVHADRWIPVLPNTDAALYLAITNVWFHEGTYDKDYLKSHAVGVEHYEDYVMGREDGVEKTPEWAAPICGVPARTTKRCAAGRYHSPGEHQAGGGRHRHRQLQRPVQPALSRGEVHRSSG